MSHLGSEIGAGEEEMEVEEVGGGEDEEATVPVVEEEFIGEDDLFEEEAAVEEAMDNLISGDARDEDELDMA